MNGFDDCPGCRALKADLAFSYENKAASDDTWRKECDRLKAENERLLGIIEQNCNADLVKRAKRMSR